MGRQQTSQSVVNRCEPALVSMTNSMLWPQKGQRMGSVVSIRSGTAEAHRPVECPCIGVRKDMRNPPYIPQDLDLSKCGWRCRNCVVPRRQGQPDEGDDQQRVHPSFVAVCHKRSKSRTQGRIGNRQPRDARRMRSAPRLTEVAAYSIVPA
jgi:hypothetical protein